MNLFHFTFAQHFRGRGSIRAEGIMPVLGTLTMSPPSVVWLTVAETPNWTLSVAQYNRRIRLVIPARDRRLMKWDQWARLNAPKELDRLNRCKCGFDHELMIADTWIYFGVMRPSMFRAVEEWAP